MTPDDMWQYQLVGGPNPVDDDARDATRHSNHSACRHAIHLRLYGALPPAAHFACLRHHLLCHLSIHCHSTFLPALTGVTRCFCCAFLPYYVVATIIFLLSY